MASSCSSSSNSPVKRGVETNVLVPGCSRSFDLEEKIASQERKKPKGVGFAGILPTHGKTSLSKLNFRKVPSDPKPQAKQYDETPETFASYELEKPGKDATEEVAGPSSGTKTKTASRSTEKETTKPAPKVAPKESTKETSKSKNDEAPKSGKGKRASGP